MTTDFIEPLPMEFVGKGYDIYVDDELSSSLDDRTAKRNGIS